MVVLSRVVLCRIIIIFVLVRLGIASSTAVSLTEMLILPRLLLLIVIVIFFFVISIHVSLRVVVFFVVVGIAALSPVRVDLRELTAALTLILPI